MTTEACEAILLDAYKAYHLFADKIGVRRAAIKARTQVLIQYGELAANATEKQTVEAARAVSGWEQTPESARSFLLGNILRTLNNAIADKPEVSAA
jgi:hypothetical protein